MANLWREKDDWIRRGEYLGILAPGFPFPDAFLEDDRIVVKEEDDLGLTSVAVHRLTR